MKISLPEDVKYIIKTINEAGYEAFAVGGCIRDSLLENIPGDYDITTSASPKTVKGLFRRTIDTGIEHGTVTVMLKRTGYEVTTYRIDGDYADKRHPSSVEFTTCLEEDLRRRDFTINAMAYNDERGLVDPFDGQKDIRDKVIRCVGDPYERFSEDALRMLRAIRFSARFNYVIEEKTLEAIGKLAGNIEAVSAERIQVELVKTLISDHPERLVTAYEAGLTKVFLPEFDLIMNTPQNHPHHCYSVGEHTIRAMMNIKNDKDLRLAMLFHDIGKPLVKTTDEEGLDHFHGHQAVSANICKEVLRRLKFDNNTIKRVSKLVEFHDIDVELSPKAVRRAVQKTGPDLFPMILLVKEADVYAQSQYKRQEKLDKISRLWDIYNEIIKNRECLCLKDLAVNGQDLISIGYNAGKEIGEELNVLLNETINNPDMNKKEILLELAVKHFSEKQRD